MSHQPPASGGGISAAGGHEGRGLVEETRSLASVVEGLSDGYSLSIQPSYYGNRCFLNLPKAPTNTMSRKSSLFTP